MQISLKINFVCPLLPFCTLQQYTLSFRGFELSSFDWYVFLYSLNNKRDFNSDDAKIFKDFNYIIPLGPFFANGKYREIFCVVEEKKFI
jgi:hypothetical protein